MPLSAICPSCGAPVVFKSSASFHAVCDFCRSTLVRHGSELENLGRMADLLEDASPIQLGSEGNYKGVHFAVIGRIQLRYAAGLWNEWYILFDDQRGGWLSDANGEYIVSFLTPPGETLPEFSTIVPDQHHLLAGRNFAVTNTENALCISGEGELPFSFGAGYPAALVDLRATDDSGAFASIDYSELPPLLFVGESLSFGKLKFANLRGGEAAVKSAGEVRALQCPSCGGPIYLHDTAIQSVACPSCLNVLEPAHKGLKVLARAAEATRIKPLIPLGSVGRFAGHEWTVIGFQQRAVTSEGVDYPWQEYLLHHATEGFRWLTESTGHWAWVSLLPASPRYQEGGASLRHGADDFIRFSAGLAETRFVIGEFNWKVSVDETWETLDFIAPPRMLSRERNANETTWSVADYLPVEEVQAAFGLERPLPAPKGIGACQPNPRKESHALVCKRFWKFFLAATLAQILWFFVGGSTVLDQRVALAPQNEDTVSTPGFRLDSPVRNLVLKHETNLSNNWIGLNQTLIEKTSGNAWTAQTEMSYWHGSDGGESWSEGDASREVIFRNLPAGNYYLLIDPEFSDENKATVVDRVKVVRNQAAWSNYLILVLFLVALPLFSRTRVATFEAGRWSNADFQSSGAVAVKDDSADDNSGGDD